MKQKGKVWYDHKGQQVPSKYLPPYEVATEKAVSSILTIAENLEKLLHSGKFDTDSQCQKAYTEYLKLNKPVTVYSFTNFDRSARVEFDVKNRWVRVYRATKENPGHKDYEMINLSFNAIVPTEAQGESVPSPQREELSGTVLAEGANGVLLQGQDRSQDLLTVSEGGEANSQITQEDSINGGDLEYPVQSQPSLFTETK
jgi:hypothetical protein